jgi:stage II sporulation protein P
VCRLDVGKGIMLKKIFLSVILVVMCLFPSVNNFVFADSFSNASFEVYSVYDEDFNLLFQKDFVEVGDEYLSSDFKLYEVVYVDADSYKGFAKFIREVSIPKVDISYAPKPISTKNRKICMYMTHNDESYLNGDGVDSVYGNGGIRDVALAFKNELEKNLIKVYFDDTLHIPHDSSAYARSGVTARSLYN